MHALRDIASYDPTVDFAERYPDWTLYRSEMPADVGEVWLPGRQDILVSRAAWDRDAEYALAHIIAHLDLDHEIGGAFTYDDEMQAKCLADVRLDREETRNDPMSLLRLPLVRQDLEGV